jgi:hypothetical protein
MSIDDKLREIVRDFGLKAEFNSFSSDKDLPVVVAQIKQAFADEGWAYLPKMTVTDLEEGREWINKNMQQVMTGQEWYDKLIEEWLRLPKDHGFVDMQDAAKRAAGIT